MSAKQIKMYVDNVVVFDEQHVCMYVASVTVNMYTSNITPKQKFK